MVLLFLLILYKVCTVGVIAFSLPSTKASSLLLYSILTPPLSPKKMATTTESSPPQNSCNLTAAGTLDSDFDIALQLQSPNDTVPSKIPDEGSSKDLNDDEVFRVYFKGMMNEERIGDDSSSTVTLAGIGVGIFNDKDEVIYELRKPLGENELSMRGVECKALIEGLNVAIDLGLKRIVLYFDYYPLYQFVSFSLTFRNIIL